jgi:hypothetical protein
MFEIVGQGIAFFRCPERAARISGTAMKRASGPHSQ